MIFKCSASIFNIVNIDRYHLHRAKLFGVLSSFYAWRGGLKLNSENHCLWVFLDPPSEAGELGIPSAPRHMGSRGSEEKLKLGGQALSMDSVTTH